MRALRCAALLSVLVRGEPYQCARLVGIAARLNKTSGVRGGKHAGRRLRSNVTVTKCLSLWRSYYTVLFTRLPRGIARRLDSDVPSPRLSICNNKVLPHRATQHCRIFGAHALLNSIRARRRCILCNARGMNLVRSRKRDIGRDQEDFRSTVVDRAYEQRLTHTPLPARALSSAIFIAWWRTFVSP